jgi:6,7-dimethyl-8-ribityllumazine synthase
MHSLTTEKNPEKPLNIAIVASSFYTVRSTENYELDLVRNALNALDIEQKIDFSKKIHKIARNGLVVDITIVPGAMELPQACQWLIDKGNVDGILAVGCVVRGKTTHYDHVCHTAISGLGQLALQTKMPIATAIVTAEDDELAKERVYAEYNGKPAKNLGFWGMKALIDIIKLKKSIYENSN